MELNDFYSKACFHIEERPIYVPKKETYTQGIIDIENKNTFLDTRHRAIISNYKDEKIVNVVPDTYKVVKNQEILDPFIDTISNSGLDYYIDDRHTFVDDSRMNLVVTFPELKMEDTNDHSDINFQIRLHNSYDGSERVRILLGYIRMVCTNGMILGEKLQTFQRKHTKNFNFEKNIIQKALDVLPEYSKKLTQMMKEPITEEFVNKLVKEYSKRVLKNVGLYSKEKEEQKYITDELLRKEMTKWQILNVLTYYISHNMQKRQMAIHQKKLSKIFN